MSNLIPMVSSSPPPMDDGGFGWDEDDDDFGTFTGADNSSYSFQDATGSEQLTKKQGGLSAGITERAKPESWPQSNGQVIQEPQEQIDSDVSIFADDAKCDKISDTSETVESRPSKIEISSDLGNQSDETTIEEVKQDYKGPLTDSGVYSADISPVQNCENSTTSRKEEDDSDSIEVSLPDVSPASLIADNCSGEINSETVTRTDSCEDVQCESPLEDGSNLQQKDELFEIDADSKEEVEAKPCKDEMNSVADPSEHLNTVSEHSSHSDTNTDQCDNDIPPHESVCANTILVTDKVADITAQDQQPSDSSKEARLSDTERTSPVMDHCDNASNSCHQDDASSCSEKDHVENVDKDLRNTNYSSSPRNHQEISDSLSNSIFVQVKATENDEDFGEFESTKDEPIPVSESTEDDNISSQKEAELSNLSCTDDGTANEAPTIDTAVQDTEDWGEFDSSTGGTDESPCDEVISEQNVSIHSNHKQENNVVCSDNIASHDVADTSDKCSGEEGKTDKNNSFKQSDNELPISSAVPLESVTKDEKCRTSSDEENEFQTFNEPITTADFPAMSKCDKEGGDFGKFKEDGDVDEDDEFGNFSEASGTTDFPVTSECDNSANDFGKFQDNANDDEEDDFGNFDKADDEFGSFDQAPDHFAAFNDPAGDAESPSEAKTDWASFSEPQIVEKADLPAEEDEEDDEWAAFSEEPVPAAVPVSQPSVSKPQPQKMSQQEKLLLAVTTVFPGVAAAGGDEKGEEGEAYPHLLTDLSGLVTEGQGEVSVWLQIKAVQATNALTYQYAKSRWNERLFHTLHVDTRNVLIGHKKAPVPAFASGLTLLEPTKGPAAPLQPDVLVDTVSKAPDSVPQSQEAIPPAQFDWSTSGLKNPLEADNKTLNLDFLIQDQAVKSNALESEFLGDSSVPVPSKPASSMQPLETILANMRNVSTMRPTPQDDGTVSGEARNIVAALPSLSFMKSKVLMFPLKLDQ